MAKKYVFLHELPINSKKLKLVFVSMLVFILLCVVGYIISNIFWDDYTYSAYSIRYRTNVTKGWPASLQGWSLWLGIGFVVFLPFIFFMQDWRNPSLGITADGLFINQQLIRNTLVPFSNIKTITPEGDQYKIIFKDTSQVVQQQFFLFRPFVKSNLAMGNFFISGMYTAGNINEIMVMIKQKISSE